jgi:uncharacterized protein with HEPN domain
MLEADRIRLQHMLDAAQEALVVAAGKTSQTLSSDRTTVLALMKDIEIIGEAATKVSFLTKERFPEIPWQKIVAMRNHLVHVYFDVDLELLWDTLTDDLPPLIATLERILAQSGA